MSQISNKKVKQKVAKLKDAIATVGYALGHFKDSSLKLPILFNFLDSGQHLPRVGKLFCRLLEIEI